MTAIVICMASAKGGSGKTTLTATFATFLSEIGKKVLIVDCDESTHGLTLLYLNEVNEFLNAKVKRNVEALGIFDTNTRLEEISSENPSKSEYFSLLTVGREISFIPATFSFLPKPPMDHARFQERLRIIVSYQRTKYDYIILDAQAGADVVSEVAVKRGISDEVVIVSEYDPLSAAGIERLKAIMGDELNYSRTWILLNKMLPEFVASFSEFLSVARYLPPIPWSAEVVRAYSKRQLALDFTTGNQFTLAVMRTLKALLPHADGIALDKWAGARVAVLRQPIEDQYKDQENKLMYIYSRLEKLESVFRVDRILYLSTLGFSVVGLAYVYLISVDNAISHRVFSIFEILNFNKGLAVSLIAVIFGLIGLFGILRSSVTNAQVSNRKFERAKLIRQKDIAEQELKRLEALRIADLDKLISSKLPDTSGSIHR